MWAMNKGLAMRQCKFEGLASITQLTDKIVQCMVCEWRRQGVFVVPYIDDFCMWLIVDLK